MIMKSKQRTSQQLAICVRNDGYEASLERRKIYRVVPDTEAARHRQLRIVDESGEDYIYPEAFFILVKLPESVER
jgi:hypothetical protein